MFHEVGNTLSLEGCTCEQQRLCRVNVCVRDCRINEELTHFHSLIFLLVSANTFHISQFDLSCSVLFPLLHPVLQKPAVTVHSAHLELIWNIFLFLPWISVTDLSEKLWVAKHVLYNTFSEIKPIYNTDCLHVLSEMRGLWFSVFAEERMEEDAMANEENKPRWTGSSGEEKSPEADWYYSAMILPTPLYNQCIKKATTPPHTHTHTEDSCSLWYIATGSE